LSWRRLFRRRRRRAGDAADDRREEREAMVRDQIEARGIRDPRVLAALAAVPRHRFLDADRIDDAYADRALPIGSGQTISQPFVVAAMTAALEIVRGDRALDVGTGSGYQAAVLAELTPDVVTVEVRPELAERARERLHELGYGGVRALVANAVDAPPPGGPFDAIAVAAAAPRVPETLLAALAPGGRMVLPVGERDQELILVRRVDGGFESRVLFPVRFVPLVEPPARR